MDKCLKVFTLIFYAAFFAPEATAQMSEPGPALNMLQQMQGAWRSDCHAMVSGSRYREIRLQVNFTHFIVTAEEFAEPDCRIMRATHKARYHFILRDPFVTLKNIEVFAIDFLPEELSPEIAPLHPLNIIKYESGTLRLGSPPAVETPARLQLLDHELMFSR